MNSKNSGFVHIFLLAVIVAIGIAGIGYLALKNGQLKMSPSPIPSNPNQTACTMEAKLCPDGSSVGRTGPNCEFTPCPSTTTFTDETANWKTYINEKYRYSLKYPPNFSLQRSTDSTTSTNFIENTFSLTPLDKPLKFPQFSISVSTTKMAPDEWINNKGYCPDWGSTPSCTPLEPGLIPNSVTFKSVNRHYGSIDTYVKKGDFLFNFSFGELEPNTAFRNSELTFYNQILSTFKFLD